MTIKEYLNFKIVSAKEDLEHAEGAENQAYTEGVLDTWNLMEDMLPSLEQELTLQEVAEFCEKRDCRNCPLNWNDNGCAVSTPPSYFDIKEITQVVREASK
jgi:hypothetical protein